MSIEDIDQAITAHLADKAEGRVLTGWVVVLSTVRQVEDETQFGTRYISSDHCDPARITGLLEMGRLKLRQDMGLSGADPDPTDDE